MVKKATLEREGLGNTMEQQCGLDFEYFVQTIFEDRDISVFETPQTNDYGADLVLYRMGKVAVIQCKYHSAPIGIRAVQEAAAAIKHYRADCGIVVTNQAFTKQAISLAKSNNILLISGAMLKEIADSVSDVVPYIDEFMCGLPSYNGPERPVRQEATASVVQPFRYNRRGSICQRKSRHPASIRLKRITR